MTDRIVTLQSGSGTDRLVLSIEDVASSITLARMELNPQQIWDLLRGSSFEVVAQMTDRLDLIGKTMEIQSVDVPGSFLLNVKYGDRAAVGERWARDNHPGWEAYEARRTNTGGVTVVLRKWVA